MRGGSGGRALTGPVAGSGGTGGGCLSSASRASWTAVSSCGSWPAATALGSCSTGTSGSTPWFSTSHVPAGEKPGLDDEFTRTPEADTFPNGCHICELEIDPDTGTLEILNYSVMDDFGTALNPLLLQGQIHGGVGQGVGQALTEKTIYDKDSGQLMSGSFMDYALPRADIVPQVHFDMHNSLCTTNPLGVKGAGEAGAIGAPPAVINAIVDAIHPHTGLRHLDMPVTAASLWAAIAANRAKKAA